MNTNCTTFDFADEDLPKSRFTYRDLRLLSQSSVSSPLRVIALVDFDCFYAQCEIVRLGLPSEQPLGVQQFKHVIAINYPARAAGLKKVVTAVEAKQKCPNIVLQHVPTWREGDTTWAYRDDMDQHMDSDKSSLDYYRLQSRKAMEVVKSTLPDDPPQKIEKAGIDELFLDLSAQVHSMLLQRYPDLVDHSNQSLDSPLPGIPTQILEWRGDSVFGTEDDAEEERLADWNDVALSLGSEVVRNLRAEIYSRLGYTCSAGIARNKVVAKLAAGHNKPNKQTVIRESCIVPFLSLYKITKLRGFGGKLGNRVVKAFGIETVEELMRISLDDMQSRLGSESGSSVYRVIRGNEHSEVVSRTQIKSMLSAKTFTPSITGLEQAERWLQIFAADIMGRMADQIGRRPRTLAVHHQANGRFGPTRSKQAPIPLGIKLDIQCLANLFRNVLVDITSEGSSWPCLTLSVSVSDFVDVDTTSHSIKSLWATERFTGGHGRAQQPYVNVTSLGTTLARPKKRTILDYQLKPTLASEESAIDPSPTGKDTNKKPRNTIPPPPNCSDEVDALGRDSIDGRYQCPNCTEIISAALVLEHLDWHVAVDLQNQG